MADRYGKFLSNVLNGTKDKVAPGHSFNAGQRRNREVILLDDGGATAVGTTIGIGTLRAGDVPDEVHISATTAALSGVSFAVGSKANPTKYAGATVGPAANATVRIKIIDASDAPQPGEELFLTTSVGALPTTGGSKMQIDTYYSHK